MGGLHFGKPGDRGVLARNNKSAYVFAINRKAEDSKTSVCFADLEFAVKEIFNVTEDRNLKKFRSRITRLSSMLKRPPETATVAPAGKQETAAKYLNNRTCNEESEPVWILDVNV